MCVHIFTKICAPLEHVHVVCTDTLEVLGTKATVKQEASDTPQPVSEHPGMCIRSLRVIVGTFVHLTTARYD